MKTPKTALTDRNIARLVAPSRGRLEVLDAKMPGLSIRVSASGYMSWTVAWHENRLARRHAIRAYPVMTLATARARTRQILTGIANGDDPITARADALRAPTVATVVPPTCGSAGRQASG